MKQKINLDKLCSPILLKGSEYTAYRDPAVVYFEKVFYLYYTLVRTEASGDVYSYTAMSTSSDLLHFSKPVLLTAKDKALNFSSPGNVIRYHDKWILCLQTYPRPKGEKYANNDARIWTMKSDNLIDWSAPEILMVKGNNVPVAEMGRMIDPYLLEDKDVAGKYWCFYKQDGVSMSYSYDLKNWTYFGHSNSGENVCVLTKKDEYVLFHSPKNGIGVMKSKDLTDWAESGKTITLGQKDWPWAQGRLTAGFVLDCREESEIGKYLMFFHGTGPEDESVIFDTYSCIGLAWSDDLTTWNWPGGKI
ncbi:MAG: hypothetical protein WCS73_09520 [Lentisphaeria bacterium]